MRMRLLGIVYLVLCGLTGCTRYYQWGEQQFKQVMKRDDCCEGSHPYVRSLDLYDGFSTVGHYDVLWYAFPVMQWHMGRFAVRVCGDSSQEYQTLYDELMQEQEQAIVFYLLITDDTDGSRQPQFSVLETSQAKWSAVMQIDEVCYTPVEIKKLSQLSPELTLCFGNDYIFLHPRYDYHYRLIYKLRFDRFSADGTDRLTQAQKIRLVLRSIAYEVPFLWCVEDDSIQPASLKSEDA